MDNLGFFVRKMFLFGDFGMNVEILLNWYGFFGSFFGEFFLNFWIEIKIEFESDVDFVWYVDVVNDCCVVLIIF